MKPIDEQANPIFTNRKSSRDEEVDEWERQQADSRARSIITTSNIPKRFRNARISDFGTSSQVYQFGQTFGPDSVGAFMEGNTGIGKTHAACALAYEFAKSGRSVRYVQSVKYIDAAMRKFSASDLEYVRQAKNAALLIFDDMGKESHDAKTLSELWSLIDDRYTAERTTIITSNLPLRELIAEYSRIKPETARALSSRIAGQPGRYAGMCVSLEVR